MTRIAIVALSLAATALTAGAMVPVSQVTGPAAHETVITKNQIWPQLGPMVFEDCFTAACEGK
jgi:hypothetical protein